MQNDITKNHLKESIKEALQELEEEKKQKFAKEDEAFKKHLSSNRWIIGLLFIIILILFLAMPVLGWLFIPIFIFAFSLNKELKKQHPEAYERYHSNQHQSLSDDYRYNPYYSHLPRNIHYRS